MIDWLNPSVEMLAGLQAGREEVQTEIEELKDELEGCQKMYGFADTAIVRKDAEIKQLREQGQELLYSLNDMALMVNPLFKDTEGLTKWTKAMDLIQRIEALKDGK